MPHAHELVPTVMEKVALKFSVFVCYANNCLCFDFIFFYFIASKGTWVPIYGRAITPP